MNEYIIGAIDSIFILSYEYMSGLGILTRRVSIIKYIIIFTIGGFLMLNSSAGLYIGIQEIKIQGSSKMPFSTY